MHSKSMSELNVSQTNTLKVFANHLASKLQDNELNDVTFIFVNEKHENEETLTINANRGLLSILSPVFRSMFKNGMKESLDSDGIPIKDVDNKSFKLLIEYFYGMDPKITSSNIGPLSYLAQKYLVDGLQTICDLFLINNISIHNIIPILESLHQYHQDKLFEKCKLWMSKQTCSDAIINLFKSSTFMNTHYNVVIILLNGFNRAVDATILFHCVLKWTETKTILQDTIVNINNNTKTYAFDDKNDEKDDEKSIDPFCKEEIINYSQIQIPSYNKWILIRKYFPFHRLPIDIICNEVLPLNILNQEMSIELLSHNCTGYQRTLAKYCITHKPLTYPLPSSTDQFFHHNLNKYNIRSENGQLIIQSNDRKMLYSNRAMKYGRIYQWTICIISVSSNPWNGFGIDILNDESKIDDNYPGHRKQNSYGLYLDKNSFWLYANGNQVYSINKGTVDCGNRGFIFTFTYNAIKGTLNIFANDIQKYTFTNIDINKTFYPSFRTHPNIIWKIIHLERPFV